MRMDPRNLGGTGAVITTLKVLHVCIQGFGPMRPILQSNKTVLITALSELHSYS